LTREYYFTDAGAQIDRCVNSLIAAARGEQAPEDGYAGDYVRDIAAGVVRENPGILDAADAELRETFRVSGVTAMFDEIKRSLVSFGTRFDVFFHEDSLHTQGEVDRVVAELKDTGKLYFADGAWWLRSSEYSDDKDRVVIKTDGHPAYIAGDIAYLRDKRSRGFDLC